MNFEDLQQALAEAIHRSGLRTIPSEDVQLDLRSLERTARFGIYVDRAVPDPFAPHLGAGARITLRWGALDTARQATCEEDVVAELLGPRSPKRTRTVPHEVRLDLRLSAGVVNGACVRNPGPAAWQRWRADLAAMGDLVDLDGNDVDDDGMLTIVAWQGQPEATFACAEDGSFQLSGLCLEAWQAVRVARRWNDPDRRPDRDPDLAALVAQWARGIDGWTAALRHLGS